MKVLITGGTGFVGAWTAKAAQDAGHEVRFLVRNVGRLSTSAEKIGVDIAGHRSKHVETIDPASVGTIITLCAEAVCPRFLGHARRLAWPLPDPAGSGGTEEEELVRFRAARDQIARHLDQLAF